MAGGGGGRTYGSCFFCLEFLSDFKAVEESHKERNENLRKATSEIIGEIIQSLKEIKLS